jgi:cyclopropane-fatty-acyl-phospholipid synthase
VTSSRIFDMPLARALAGASDRAARRLLAAVLDRMRGGRLTITEAGRLHSAAPAARPVGEDDTLEAAVVVHDSRFWRALLRGSRGVAESYRDGLWDSPDLTAVIRLGARNAAAFDRVRQGLAPLRVPYHLVSGRWAANSPARSRRDISRHYDLGNELFELMLDPTMMYSCAVFERPGMTLEQASLAKLERICAKLDLGPRDHVLEIGAGWGGFAVHAAAHHGCRVTTTTISREQHDRARERVRAAGLADRVTVLFQDYRELRGRFDKLVSIEMIEAVGWRDLPTFFHRCSELLAAHGTMLLQAITIDDRAYEVEKTARTFIRSHIFPNGCLPSLEVIGRCVARHTDMRAIHLEDLTPHYAETLRRWRGNVERHAERLEALGYDERFRRLWRLYLAWCEAGFTERRIGDVQLVLAKPAYRGEARLGARLAGQAAAALSGAAPPGELSEAAG